VAEQKTTTSGPQVWGRFRHKRQEPIVDVVTGIDGGFRPRDADRIFDAEEIVGALSQPVREG
jgi:hypothetical protein